MIFFFLLEKNWLPYITYIPTYNILINTSHPWGHESNFKHRRYYKLIENCYSKTNKNKNKISEEIHGLKMPAVPFYELPMDYKHLQTVTVNIVYRSFSFKCDILKIQTRHNW